MMATASSLSILSPWTGEFLQNISYHSAQDLDVATQCAQKAQKDWAKRTPRERCKIFHELHRLITRNQERLAQSISQESGKLLSEAHSEIAKGLEEVEMAATLFLWDHSTKQEVSQGIWCESRRRPMGVVGIITPFNFPAMIPLWMIPLALASGNAVIWKPSERASLTSDILGPLFDEAGLPENLLHILKGDSVLSNHLLLHPAIRSLAFVGSTPVAKKVYALSAQEGKKVLALGGAKNHLLMLEDAPEDSVNAVVDSFTGCAGQRCMAGSVLITVGDPKVAEERRRAILHKLKSFKLGVHMGAMISMEALHRLQEVLASLEAPRQELLCDGRSFEAPHGKGYWLGPSMILHHDHKDPLLTRELFGPILSCVHIPDLSMAMNIVQRSSFGNALSIFTSQQSQVEAILEDAPVGMVGVNVGLPVPRSPFSFGGMKDSKFGLGDITGPGAMGLWTDWQKITSKYPRTTFSQHGSQHGLFQWMS